MTDLLEALNDTAAATSFSGAVRVDLPGPPPLRVAYGLADRRCGVSNTPTTRFAVASVAKTFTAVTVLRLVERGVLSLATPVRELLGDDLPLIGDAVTVEHLLAHRSGIGDYCDEDEQQDDNALPPFAVQQLTGTADYVAVLDGYPAKFQPGEAFSYCNGGYVVLALVAQRAAQTQFEALVDECVSVPAGMVDTAFLRSDALPAGCATGYLAAEGLRTNIFHLPLVGSGDGGIYTTLDDIHRFWEAFIGGRLIAPASVASMVTPRSTDPTGTMRYGFGIWLAPAGNGLQLEGADVGVGCRSVCDRDANVTYTVVSNTTDGAWPMARMLRERLAGG